MISIIIPFYNEAESLQTLIKHLIEVNYRLKERWEMILVDDGSTDAPRQNFQFPISNFQKNPIKLIRHRKRFGKGKALETGVKNSSGETIIFMDGDLQDDPEDLPKFIDKINKGYDLVNGIRTGRHRKNFFLRTYSLLAEKFLKIFTDSPYEDINCGFKAFKRKVLDNFVFYGNNFRFFPLAVFYNGYKVTEIQVKNNQRKFGKSKFGPNKLFLGAFDTLTAYFIYQFAEKPLHFFGPIGLTMFIIGFLISLYLAIERLFFNVLLYRRPVLFLGILLIIVGVQIVMTGIIGELIVYLNKSNIKNQKAK